MVGVSFLGKKAVYAQQIRDNGEPVVETIGEAALPTAVNLASLDNPNFRYELQELFETIKNQLPFPDRQVTVILPHEWYHAYRLDIDSDLNPDEQTEYAQWDFRQRFGQHHEQFRVHFSPLNTTEDPIRVLAIGFPENLLSVIHSATDNVHLELESVDVDCVVAWINLPNSAQSQYLCKFTDSFLTISKIRNDVLTTALLYSLPPGEDSPQYLRGFSSDNAISTFHSAVTELLAGNSHPEMSFICYGNDIPDNVQTFIAGSDQCEVLSPFEGFRVNFRDQEQVDTLKEAQYGEIAGVLRQMNSEGTYAD